MVDTRFDRIGTYIALCVVAAIAFAFGFAIARNLKKPEGVVTARDAQAGVTCYIAHIGDAMGISCLTVAEKPEVKKGK